MSLNIKDPVRNRELIVEEARAPLFLLRKGSVIETQDTREVREVVPERSHKSPVIETEPRYAIMVSGRSKA